MANVQSVTRLRAELDKRATFEKAAHELETLTTTDPGFSSSEEAMLLAKRCVAVLRARHTNPSYWSAGHSYVKVVCTLSCIHQYCNKLSV